MNFISGIIRVLFTPRCWVNTGTYSKEWDASLNRRLLEHTFRADGMHTAMLGDIKVWIANHPYASFSTYDHELGGGPIPKRITMLRAMDKYDKEVRERPRDIISH